MSEIIRIATRESPLALWQANAVRDQLLALDPETPVELRPMKTKGDIWLKTSLAKLGGKGLFCQGARTRPDGQRSGSGGAFNEGRDRCHA